MMIFVFWLANLDNKVDMRKFLVEFRSLNGFTKHVSMLAGNGSTTKTLSQEEETRYETNLALVRT
ncbi:hypothetical protein A3X80_12970 [Salmonella enterica subsp. enterica serovar Schwarzengrund]|nr:hypothetical protein [Salmonella enterica subsp. enterica]EAS7341398.1 hypothetical protein [Salmonella enterica]ECB7619985.1 hypothetical protein [Salmonella enterica subsp. enterica serovar Schwarzengrund]EAV0523780.1 hypothetical protein [Salmonella enterica]EBI8625438.1 hypothetical protein [Salmonella enterica]